MTSRKSPADLREYRAKRDFRTTPEPAVVSGKRAKPRRRTGSSDAHADARFVVHEHHARRLHWDLRLERDGVLASWAIPNGIPGDPKHNRKAIHVEDHPLDYLDFAGEIPVGQYGAGDVSIWDTGTYECEKWRSGEVIAVFHGERLRGRYALFHAGKDEKDWMIHRMDPPVDPDAQEMPQFVEPMLARLSTLPAEDSSWAFEVKWDGVRAICRSEPGRLKLWSRNRNDVTGAYPELRALGKALGSRSAMLDGEVVAFNADGRPSFELLQTRMHVRGESQVRRLAEATPVAYMIFDLLWLDGHPLMDLPFSERRERLSELGLDGERWSVPGFHIGEGEAFLAATREQGLEGLVAKRLDSRYAPGRRDAGWLKVKNNRRQEAVIGGYTRGKGARSSTIGALHLGVHEEGEDGGLRYAGKVGTGFDDAELRRLHELLEPLERRTSPFTGPQPPRGARFVEPRLVCEVTFGSWTKDGILRHSVYKGLRNDKDPGEVGRERVTPAAAKVKSSGGVKSARRSSATDRRPSAREGKDDRAGSLREKTIEASLASLLAGSREVQGGVEIECEGRSLKLTNLGKVLYPDTGFTKGELIGYYAALAPAILPHLKGRPLTLKRYPNGVDHDYFFEKHCPLHRPEWVKTIRVFSESNGRGVDYCLCEDLPTLVWLSNLAAIELHPSLSRGERLERPTAIAFDLDPGAPAGMVECCRVALELRDVFSELSLSCYPKTSGSKGLQVYVPLNVEGASYEDTKPFAHAVADVLERRHPDLVVSRMAKAKRRGKVLIDWSQNDEHKTTVAVYSLRAKVTPSASTPLQWKEVERCRDAADASMLDFEPRDLPARIGERGDLFAKVGSERQRLPSLGV